MEDRMTPSDFVTGARQKIKNLNDAWWDARRVIRDYTDLGGADFVDGIWNDQSEHYTPGYDLTKQEFIDLINSIEAIRAVRETQNHDDNLIKV
jgi:hypothetical protein